MVSLLEQPSNPVALDWVDKIDLVTTSMAYPN
jgi:hypothetical protein